MGRAQANTIIGGSKNKSWGTANNRFANVRLSSTIGGTTVASSERKLIDDNPSSNAFSNRKLSELNSTVTTGITLHQVKKIRRNVDTDVQKLHNRIRMLQIEEERALKKIDETRKKAKNILDIR